MRILLKKGLRGLGTCMITYSNEVYKQMLIMCTVAVLTQLNIVQGNVVAEDATVDHGKDANITCGISSPSFNPATDVYKWTFNDPAETTIALRSQVQSAYIDQYEAVVDTNSKLYTLVVKNASFADSTQYKCAHKFSSVVASLNVTAYAIYQKVSLKPSIPDQKFTKTGDKVEIIAKVINTKPPALMYWTIQVTGEPPTNLTDSDVNTASETWGEVYNTTSTANVTAPETDAMKSLNACVHVYAPLDPAHNIIVRECVLYDLPSPPQINSISNSSTVTPPSAIQLSCNASGFPEPIVQWFECQTCSACANSIFLANGTLLKVNITMPDDCRSFMCIATQLSTGDSTNSTVYINVTNPVIVTTTESTEAPMTYKMTTVTVSPSDTSTASNATPKIGTTVKMEHIGSSASTATKIIATAGSTVPTSTADINSTSASSSAQPVTGGKQCPALYSGDNCDNPAALVVLIVVLILICLLLVYMVWCYYYARIPGEERLKMKDSDLDNTDRQKIQHCKALLATGNARSIELSPNHKFQWKELVIRSPGGWMPKLSSDNELPKVEVEFSEQILIQAIAVSATGKHASGKHPFSVHTSPNDSEGIPCNFNGPGPNLWEFDERLNAERITVQFPMARAATYGIKCEIYYVEISQSDKESGNIKTNKLNVYEDRKMPLKEKEAEIPPLEQSFEMGKRSSSRTKLIEDKNAKNTSPKRRQRKKKKASVSPDLSDDGIKRLPMTEPPRSLPPLKMPSS